MGGKCSPEKKRINSARWAKNNPDKVKKSYKRWKGENSEYLKRAWLRRAYNLTLEDYQKMLDDSGGFCEICSKPFDFDNREPCVDHDHVTGIVRGLLCQKCNTGIGMLNDDATILQKAADYLREK